METTKERNHALSNCVGQLESIKELYRNYQEAESNDGPIHPETDCGARRRGAATGGRGDGGEQRKG